MSIIQDTLEQGEGIFRMVPNFIPVKFGVPGRRLKIHPNDYFAFGTDSGTIMERWLCAVNPARAKDPANPLKGLSFVRTTDGGKFLFRDAVSELKESLIGEELQSKYGTFPVYSKFFDYETPLYFHFHPKTEIARRVGCDAKPECYYFPPQLNNYVGRRPSTYMGFNTGAKEEEIRECVRHFGDFDTHITRFSRAFDIEVGTGWYVPAGIIHAPGSLLTYEPQWCTDLNCVLENVVCGEVFSERYMLDVVPEEVENKVDYIMNAIDFDMNLDPDFKKHYYRPPVETEKSQDGLIEKWIAYNNEFITAKEVTVLPGHTVVLKDKAAYGCVLTQGFGSLGNYDAEVVTMIRVGDQTADEYFVSKDRAIEGVKISNRSKVEPLVMLQHFGPDNAIYIK